MYRALTNLTDFLNGVVASYTYPLSFLHPAWRDLEAWKTAARRKVRELLLWDPPRCDHAPELRRTIQRHNYTIEDIRIRLTPHTETAAYVLVPEGKGPFPALVGLHCHGGHFRHGREKLVRMDDEPGILRHYRQRLYHGSGAADFFAGHGYLVIVIDSIVFGSRRLEGVRMAGKPWILDAWRDYERAPEGDEKIARYHRAVAVTHSEITKQFLMAGITWPGVFVLDDIRTIDYLLTRDDVDPERLGCFGLSYGGFRSAMLAGLDRRLKAAVVSGWMTDLAVQVAEHGHAHTGMNMIPGLLQYLDLPDLSCCLAPAGLYVQHCRLDKLYPMRGMESSAKKIRAIYQKADCPDRAKIDFYDAPHAFNVEMQHDALAWFEKFLKH